MVQTILRKSRSSTDGAQPANSRGCLQLLCVLAAVRCAACSSWGSVQANPSRCFEQRVDELSGTDIVVAYHAQLAQDVVSSEA